MIWVKLNTALKKMPLNSKGRDKSGNILDNMDFHGSETSLIILSVR